MNPFYVLSASIFKTIRLNIHFLKDLITFKDIDVWGLQYYNSSGFLDVVFLTVI